LGAPRIGLGVGLILAARHVVGVLRLGAPAMIGRLADRKRFCIGAFLLSAAALLGLPLAAAPGVLPSPGESLAALVVLWCLYHLLEYLGVIAMWSWFADLVPGCVRGRFIGTRERWMTLGVAAGTLAAGAFAWGWLELHAPPSPKWIAYAIPAVVGAGLIGASIAPLVLIPLAARNRIVRRGATLGELLAPFRDSQFLRLLAFGCWFSFFNGVTQSAQNLYPIRVLEIGLFVILALQTGMRGGQLTVSPWLGRLADRAGNRPVMGVCLLLAATGPLFYLAATPEDWWWIAGAWVVWIAYAGLNVGLPNLLLRVSPRAADTPYIAAYYAVTGLCYAASTIAGGELLDRTRDLTLSLFGDNLTLGFYQWSFLVGWITRSLGVLVLLLVIERPHELPRTE
jgi:MFS family permease